MRRARGGLAVLVLAAGTALAAPATSRLPVVPVSTRDLPSRGHPCQASVRPGIVRIGQPVLYRGRVLIGRGDALLWLAPAEGGALEWSTPRVRRIPAYTGSRNRAKEVLFADTLQVEVSLQAFTPGMLTVPGLGFEVREANGSRWTGHLPVVRLGVASVVSLDDTSASLRPLRGPLGAPWWERVPWRIVGLVAPAMLLAVFVVWRLKRRRAPIAGHVRLRPPKDPATVALEALEALRGLRLPDHGRYAGHAFELTRILRRFLEATQGAPRPGDSTPESVVRLGATRLAPAERERVAELLATWDRVKFARVASSPAEARRAEDAVEGLIRRPLAGAGEGGA
jgi:hypothetical protein